MEEVRSLILRITERCNLQCSYCYAASDSNADMTEEMALKAVTLCCQPGGSLSIQFTGGEPLLKLSLLEAVYNFGKATNRRLRLAVQTNGTLLTPETCRRLAAIKCAVGVSMDGVGEINRLRIFPDESPTFPAVVQGIRNLGTAGVRCNLTTVVTQANAAQLGQLPDLALLLGNVTGVGLDLFRPIGRGAAVDYSPTEEELTAGLRALIYRTREIQAAGVPFRLRELERLKKRNAASGCNGTYCYAQTEYSMAVDSTGNCWPCSSLVGQEGCFLGNIRDGLPRNPRITCGLAPTRTCTACANFSLCAGGCPAGRAANLGDPNPLTCVMHRILLEELEGVTIV